MAGRVWWRSGPRGGCPEPQRRCRAGGRQRCQRCQRGRGNGAGGAAQVRSTALRCAVLGCWAVQHTPLLAVLVCRGHALLLASHSTLDAHLPLPCAVAVPATPCASGWRSARRHEQPSRQRQQWPSDLGPHRRRHPRSHFCPCHMLYFIASPFIQPQLRQLYRKLQPHRSPSRCFMQLPPHALAPSFCQAMDSRTAPSASCPRARLCAPASEGTQGAQLRQQSSSWIPRRQPP